MMATYNGEQFVRSQIDSILAQRDVNVTLLIHDDGSSDSTFAICSEYAAAHPNVIAVRNERNLGVTKNFMDMLCDGNADGFDFYAFSDQDDEWFDDKLSHATMSLLAQGLTDQPALYFSDIRNEWVDENDQCIHQELEISRFRNCEAAPMTLLVRNWVNGCAMVFNPALRDLIVERRPDSIPRIHDVWVHMVARYCGTIVSDYDQVLMRRRLTGSNVVGKTNMHIASVGELRKLVGLTFSDNEHPMHECAKLFLDTYQDEIAQQYLQPLRDFVNYRDSPASTLKLMRSKLYWLPSKSARLRMKVAMLLGFY